MPASHINGHTLIVRDGRWKCATCSTISDSRMDYVNTACLGAPPEAPAVEAATALMEEGRRLASERDNLIEQGVDPSEMAIPIAPVGGKESLRYGACKVTGAGSESDLSTGSDCQCPTGPPETSPTPADSKGAEDGEALIEVQHVHVSINAYRCYCGVPTEEPLFMGGAALASDWLASLVAAREAEALREAEFEIRDAKTVPIVARAAICAVLRGRADRIAAGSSR